MNANPTHITLDDGTKYIRSDLGRDSAITDGLCYVIVRSRNQGVMCGYLVSYEGQCVTLHNARQMYEWDSSFLLPDMAELGPRNAGACRFSAPMSKLMIMTEACGILQCSEKATKEILDVPAEVHEQ